MTALSRRVLHPVVLATIGAAIVLATSWTAASAQYPAPVGSVTTSVSDTTPTIGSTVDVQVKVLDTVGNPVANEVVDLSIISQPGTDASLTSATAVTDENGIVTVTLSTGSVPGTIVVGATARGVQSQATVEAQAAAAASPTPAASPGVPPPTGVGGTEGDGSVAPWVLAALTAGAAGFLSLFVWRVVAGRTKSN